MSPKAFPKAGQLNHVKCTTTPYGDHKIALVSKSKFAGSGTDLGGAHRRRLPVRCLRLCDPSFELDKLQIHAV